ncbi:Gfo/Idh/MocA family protein [Agromyces sp. Marseille-P2726]|uniref:Gfo/Idh/MocA family protein n=1 Tax=Agromyces sp. Marseille-P2726 TaxID=2709132 RepID=UPI00156D8F4A|nr:Gfo/Idh/MocA family oxidoreductase [Agromyces sp. Marseille-P2726]
MTERLRWGILATGGIARAFTNDLHLNGLTVQAVGSRSRASAEAFASEFGIADVHGSYESLAADPDVDVVYVATPHPMHARSARLMLEAGKHVLVEKPFTLNQREAQELADVAAARGLLVLEAMWTRYLPHMARVREILAEGTLGEVRTLIVDHTQKLSDDPLHRINALELGGGALLDLGVYPVSFAWDVFGAPATIQSTATFKPTGADAQVATIFGYRGDRMASMVTASDVLGPNTATVIGTDGRIEIDRTWYMPTSFRVVAADGAVIEEFRSEVVGRGMHFQAEAVERLVAEGNLRGDLLTIDESIAIMGTLDAIREQIGLRYPGE